MIFPMNDQPEHEPDFKCATFDQALQAAIPPEIRARMDRDRAEAQAKAGKSHRLKCWPPFFAEICAGVKTFEVRPHDRDFAVGDELCLEEWDPATGCFTHRFERVRVTYLLVGGQFGIGAGYCVLGIRLRRPAPFRAECAEPLSPT